MFIAQQWMKTLQRENIGNMKFALYMQSVNYVKFMTLTKVSLEQGRNMRFSRRGGGLSDEV